MVTPRIGIITALPKECWAMRAFIDSWKEVYIDGRGAGRSHKQCHQDNRRPRNSSDDLHGKTDTVIDAKTNQWLTTISRGGGAGNSQYDYQRFPSGQRVVLPH